MEWRSDNLNIEWYDSSKRVGPSFATLATYGISLNKAASKQLGNVRYVKVGFPKETRTIAIKPLLSDEHGSLNLAENVDGEQKRINKKDLIQAIVEKFDLNLQNSLRLPCQWSDKYDVLILDVDNATISNG